MTDRHQYLTVVLDGDYRDDDAQPMIDAISMIKGVASVELGKPVDTIDHMARLSARRHIRDKILKIILED